ncbi:DUF1295 domain-containing protein [Kribbella sp. NPDC051587]|uniref:DUF1295 domain-containing protein n=1 Tax=Kribbella sp. NPDC051587 TaxID=3364119 RepID=UPI0037A64FF1
MALLLLFVQCVVLCVGLVTVFFVVALLRGRRYDVIDSGWGLLFLAVALYSFITSPNRQPVGWIAVAAVSSWSIRLASHIFRRWLRAPDEDPRYVVLRRNWSQRWLPLQMYLRVYLVQAVLACVVSLPVIALLKAQPDANALVYAGLTLWAIGFALEVVADRQLAAFLAPAGNRGQLMTTGLWRYSRHPNYLGELTLWWGLAVMALATPDGWIGLVGAGTLTVLIVFVSGIPPAERRAERKPGWSGYRTRTPVLLPLPGGRR